MAKAMAERERRKETDEVADAERQAKEEAGKPQAVFQPDTLQQRLIRLDEAARRVNHPNTERYNLVLQRFTHNRSAPEVGQLVLTLLSTKEESALLEKERKFLKKSAPKPTAPTEHAHPNEPWAQLAQQPQTPPGQNRALADPYSFYQHWAAMAPAHPSYSTPGRYNRRGGYSSHRGGQRRHFPRDDTRDNRDNRDEKCYRCGRLGHFARDCGQKDQK